MPPPDLTGRRFGRLTVLEKSPERDPRRPGVLWRCACDCGREKLVPTHNLLAGLVKSCGCLRDENRRLDLTGQRRGRLTAIRNTGDRRDGKSLWLWKCDCGQELILPAHHGRACCESCAAQVKADQARAMEQRVLRDAEGRSVRQKEAILAGKPTAQNTSGVRGVSWHRGLRKWQARMSRGGKTVSLGYYDTLEDAAEARRKAVADWYDPSS